MATWNNSPTTPSVLEAAAAWRQNCLQSDGSVFSDERLWTAEHLAELSRAFLDNPILGSGRFIDKLAQQLSGCPATIQRLGAEAVWLLLLFVSPRQMGAQVKRERVTQIWSLTGGAVPVTSLLDDSHLAGMAKPGAAFMAKMPDELGYALSIIHAFKELPRLNQQALLSDPWRFGSWLDSREGSDRRAFRHMLLFFCFPESYERICSWRHKRRIRDVFTDHVSVEERRIGDTSLLSIDQALLAIRRQLEQEYGTDKLDFYLPPLRQLWLSTDRSEDAGPDDETTETRHFWIEKTIVSGRPDREQGEHALGVALWSPLLSKACGDIYTNMRRLKAGDIVFHLTDNEAISGVSVASGGVDASFVGLAGTAWEGPAYRIQLQDFEKLSPPLQRESFFDTEPFSTELRELAEASKGLFYNRNLELNQGAYLTEATPTLLSILNRAYQAQSDKALPYLALENTPPAAASAPVPSKPYGIDDALQNLFLDRAEAEDILLLWAAKKNVILQGPPGVGKSFAAQRLAFALMGAEDRDRLGFVQFHQSYSYEDFVEGFRPTATGFELRPGKFVEFCRRAESDPDRTYVFIIDEINRGNLSKILGELMLLIEGDKRDPGWAMSLASGKVPFHVPANVYVMGLMNTADRSLAVVDYALRRRFAFFDLKPKLGSPKFREQLERAGVPARLVGEIVSRVGALNEAISSDVTNLGPGFAIGHSFFCAGPRQRGQI
jgi:hypothetical protein